jgi:3-phosphoglycerate kinase
MTHAKSNAPRRGIAARCRTGDTKRSSTRSSCRQAGPDRSLFYNGVAGKFEDARFADGTQSLIESVERFAGAGGAVYVGGGEGRSAFLRFADRRSARHVFTLEEPVLKAVAGRPCPCSMRSWPAESST